MSPGADWYIRKDYDGLDATRAKRQWAMYRVDVDE